MTRKVWRPFEPTRQALLARVVEGERLLAQGRLDEIERGRAPSGSTYDYIVVTDKRLLVGKRALGSDRSRDFDIDLDAIGSSAEHFEGHRWFIHLRHGPVTRVRHRTKHNLLGMHWGSEWSPVAERDTGAAFQRAGDCGREGAA